MANVSCLLTGEMRVRHWRFEMMTAEILDMLVQHGPAGAATSVTAGQRVELGEQSHLHVMRSIASRDDVSAYIDACVEEMVGTLKAFADSRKASDRNGMFQQLHRLKQLLMNGGFAMESEACGRVMDSMRGSTDTDDEGIDDLGRMAEGALDALMREPEYAGSRRSAAE
jgi:hypothetical protein